MTLQTRRRDVTLDSQWATAPRYRVPHPSVLVGAANLLVAALASLPMILLGQVRSGLSLHIFVAITAINAAVSAIPLFLAAARGPATVVSGLLFANVTPLMIALTGVPTAPHQVWANLLVVPVLLMAASANQRIFHLQVAAGFLIGPIIIAASADAAKDAVGNSVVFLWVMCTCAFLTRRAWIQVERRFTALHENSHRDELTGLYNRRGLLASFPALRARTMLAGAPFGIVMIDIDHFSVINDDHGHHYGDAVLKQICDLVAEQSPPNCLVARIGGEEFVLLVPGSAEPAAVAIHTAIRVTPIHPGLTVSMGIVDAEPEPCSRIDQLWALIHLADSAMYLAKQNGRDRIIRLTESAGTDQNAHAAQGIPVPTGTEPADRPATARRRLPSRLPSTAAATATGTGTATGTATTSTDPSTPPAVSRPMAPSRLIGLHFLGMACVGLAATLTPLALDPAHRIIPILLGALALLAILGILNLAVGSRLPSWFPILPLLCAELAVVLALPAISNPDLRLSTFGLVQVPLAIAAQLLSRRALLTQFLVVLIVAAAAAYQANDGAALWLQHTIALTALICVPSGILHWLRQRCLIAETELGLLGTLDPLTGLTNRFGLQEALVPSNSALTKSREKKHSTARPLYLIQANINGFKLLNDHYGHGFGDEALKMLAQTLASVVNHYSTRSHSMAVTDTPAAIVARVAGDRFLVAQVGGPDLALYNAIRIAVTQMPMAFTVALGQAHGEVSTSTQMWALTSAADRDLTLHKN